MVFISWSKETSRRVAVALRSWLPEVIQNISVWVSDIDIAAGSRNATEISDSLLKAKVGIVCLTPSNLVAPWLLFEAGAISKAVGNKNFVCPYLFGLKITAIQKPLADFQ